MDIPSQNLDPLEAPPPDAAGPQPAPPAFPVRPEAGPAAATAGGQAAAAPAPGPVSLRYEFALPPGSVMRDGLAWVPAGLQPRIYAFLLDAIILSLLHSALVALAQINMGDPAMLLEYMMKQMEKLMSGAAPDLHSLSQVEQLQRPLLLAGWLNIGLCAAYFTLFHGLVGTTLGKGMLGLRVMRRDGSDLGLLPALLRYVVYAFTAKLGYTAWLIPFESQRRALHDIAAGTNVFRALPATQAQPWQAQV